MEENVNLETEQEIEQDAGTETLDWKSAAKKLKEALSKIDDSIDMYHKKVAVTALRARYNDKERTPELFNDIMDLEV